MFAAFAMTASPGVLQSATCTSAGAGAPQGTVSVPAIKEASGLAVSARNPGVLWTHNDGSSKKVFALNLQAELLARYDTGVEVNDVEDISVGPGPVPGTSYLYLADSGGAAEASEVRSSVRIVRIPEPAVGPSAPSSPPSVDFSGVASFTLTYPDGAFDAETLLVDPRTADVFVVTKQKPACRLYRANLGTAASGATLALTFVRTITFGEPSGGDVSPDGSQIILRNEDAAVIWNRTEGESVGSALGRAGTAVPVIGTPAEPNGEAVALLKDGAGYLTLSEEANPVLYFFEFQCPRAPSVMSPLVDRVSPPGGTVTFRAQISGIPAPTYSWKFNGAPIAGEAGPALTLAGAAAAAGTYELTATNSAGAAVTSATLTLGAVSDLRVTEISAQPASGPVKNADWWELSSFSQEPVNLTGWRFNDDGGGLGTAFVLPAGLTIAPGESIVFVEDLSPAEFRAWWGAAHVPESVQIITYSGAGLAFSANGDGLRLWNAAAASDGETSASIDFGVATPGVTFNYDPATAQFGALSRLGVNGVFKAAAAPDIGSPGIHKAPAAIPDLTVSATASGIRIDFSTKAGTTYRLEETGDPATEGWSATGDGFTAASDGTGFFERPVTGGRRFYRILVL